MARPKLWMSFAVSVACMVGLILVVFVPTWLYPSLTSAQLAVVTEADRRIALQQAQGQLQSDARSSVLQALGGLVLVLGALAAWRQAQISQQSQVTERITKAVDQMANTSMDVRVAGIYALQRVAHDSAVDRGTITSILATFIRTHAPHLGPALDHHRHPRPDLPQGPPWTGTVQGDVQIALYALASRPRDKADRSPFLSFTDLRKARMGDRDWSDLVCQYADLAGAWLRNARLDRALLSGTDMREANLTGASLVDARLDHVHLTGAILRVADLRGADLTNACLDRADLSDIKTDGRTKWPDGFDPA